MNQNITFEQFEEQFKPKINHIALKESGARNKEDCAPVNGLMYETYGEEFKHVKTHAPENVWTVVVVDEDDEEDEIDKCWYILKGFHLVNRMGYIITENKWNDETPDAEY